MNKKAFLLVFYVLLIAGGLFLARVDYSSKLDTDVSSLLPTIETEEARIVRRLISEEQGRSVYLAVDGLPLDSDSLEAIESELLKELRASPWIGSVTKIGANSNLAALKVVNENRMELLFPRWLAEKQALFAKEGMAGASFADWAAVQAVQDMDAFLESPVAIELARPELMDPLLLSIRSLESLSESQSGGLLSQDELGKGSSGLYWAVLAESPLSPETQEGLGAVLRPVAYSLSEMDSDLALRYGGLVKLAGASRKRIQKDVFKINVLSVLGVFIVSGMLVRRPWRLLWAIPTLMAGVVGALTVSFLVFDQVNVIVLVIGSILIGTAIDYAIHLLFKEQSVDSFPTGRLVAYACLSTVAGFSILLFSELPLIRQIGVFVGSGLLSAYAMAKLSIVARPVIGQSGGNDSSEERRRVPVFVTLAIALMAIGGYGLTGVDWTDDLRNFEAPDPALVQEDLELRSEFASIDSSSVFMSTGESYLDVLQNEQTLMERVGGAGSAPNKFGFSRFLSTRSHVEILRKMKGELPRFFDKLEVALEEGGYERGAFDSFFDSASAFRDNPIFDDHRFEERIQRFANELEGPMKGSIGESEGRFWSMSSISIPISEASEIASSLGNTTLFSQLNFLNDMLDEHREALYHFGAIAMLLVTIAIVLVSGLKKGILVVLYPIMGGVMAIGLCSLLFGSLNMFHLVGCFLGGAIALDYALFALESYSRGLAMPRSVWISAGTTTASFLALSFSAIPVVQGLGAMVAFLACLTLLLLHSSQSILRKALYRDSTANNVSN